MLYGTSTSYYQPQQQTQNYYQPQTQSYYQPNTSNMYSNPFISSAMQPLPTYQQQSYSTMNMQNPYATQNYNYQPVQQQSSSISPMLMNILSMLMNFLPMLLGINGQSINTISVTDEDLQPVTDEDLPPVTDEDLQPLTDEDLPTVTDEDIQPNPVGVPGVPPIADEPPVVLNPIGTPGVI